MNRAQPQQLPASQKQRPEENPWPLFDWISDFISNVQPRSPQESLRKKPVPAQNITQTPEWIVSSPPTKEFARDEVVAQKPAEAGQMHAEDRSKSSQGHANGWHSSFADSSSIATSTPTVSVHCDHDLHSAFMSPPPPTISIHCDHDLNRGFKSPDSVEYKLAGFSPSRSSWGQSTFPLNEAFPPSSGNLQHPVQTVGNAGDMVQDVGRFLSPWMNECADTGVPGLQIGHSPSPIRSESIDTSNSGGLVHGTSSSDANYAARLHLLEAELEEASTVRRRASSSPNPKSGIGLQGKKSPPGNHIVRNIVDRSRVKPDPQRPSVVPKLVIPAADHEEESTVSHVSLVQPPAVAQDSHVEYQGNGTFIRFNQHHRLPEHEIQKEVQQVQQQWKREQELEQEQEMEQKELHRQQQKEQEQEQEMEQKGPRQQQQEQQQEQEMEQKRLHRQQQKEQEQELRRQRLEQRRLQEQRRRKDLLDRRRAAAAGESCRQRYDMVMRGTGPAPQRPSVVPPLHFLPDPYTASLLH